MIRIEKLKQSHQLQVLAIQLAEEHIKYASTPQAFIADTTELVDKYVVFYFDEIVGFFKLDIGYSRNQTFCPQNSLGMRSFALDARHQGKGIGTRCIKALPLVLARTYSDYEFVYLTVNCKNLVAKACYLKGGFEDTGELYFGGPAGPQHIMRLNIEQSI